MRRTVDTALVAALATGSAAAPRVTLDRVNEAKKMYGLSSGSLPVRAWADDRGRARGVGSGPAIGQAGAALPDEAAGVGRDVFHNCSFAGRQLDGADLRPLAGVVDGDSYPRSKPPSPLPTSAKLAPTTG